MLTCWKISTKSRVYGDMNRKSDDDEGELIVEGDLSRLYIWKWEIKVDELGFIRGIWKLMGGMKI